MENFASADATATVAALRNGALTATAALQACLERIASRDSVVGAWAHVATEAALAAARQADATGRPGPLAGLPIGVKDILTTHDMPTGYNSPIYHGPDAPLAAPLVDAAAVALLRQAGAIIVGKTQTVEFAAIGSPPRTCNPHDSRRTPGGSSSGSAAAVADGHVTVALGTQTGGSIIRPAGFCGTWALKPTWGLVPGEGVKPFAPSLDTVGWFARSARDLGLILGIFAPASPALQGCKPASLEGLRIATWRTAGWPQAEAATISALDNATATLRQAGAIVSPLPVLDEEADLAQLHQTVMLAEGARSFLREYRTARDLLHPRIAAMVRDGEAGVSDALARAHDRAAQARRQFDAIAGTYDAVLAPSTPGEAPLGLGQTGSLLFNGLLTLLHVPCLNLPLWRSAQGLPIGLTLTGPRHGDHRLVAMAETISSALAGGQGV